jgi:hypothetical protein
VVKRLTFLCVFKGHPSLVVILAAFSSYTIYT